jgi:flagellar hook-associated protein FlgK
MTINSVLNTGVQGMLQSQRQINQAASEIAQVSTSEAPLQTAAELTEPLINMKIEQNVFDASAKVVTTADEMLGTLLDTTA